MQPRRTPSAKASRFLRFRRNKSGKTSHYSGQAKIKSQLALHKANVARHRENALLKYSLFCCALVTVAHGANAVNAIALIAPPERNTDRPPPTSGDRSLSAERANNMTTFMNATCSSTAFYPINKPLRLRFDKDTKGTDTAAACLKLENLKQCKEEKDVTSQWINNPSLLVNISRLDNQRQKAYSDARVEWRRSTIDCYVIGSSLNGQQAKIFNQYCQLLREIELLNQYANQAVRSNIGNCDEHTAYNFMKLFRYSIENNQPIKLQKVDFDSLIPGRGHTFLLIDSDAEDIAIYRNRNAVTDYLKQIKRGKICDSWNAFLFIPVAEKNAYYGSGWESVVVKTYPTHFDLRALPDGALNFFRREFLRLGINLELRPNANEDNIENDDEQVAALRIF